MMRSGYCFTLKYVPVGDYVIEMKVNGDRRFQLTHIMILWSIIVLIYDSFNKLSVDGLSIATIRKLYLAGFDTPIKILKASINVIIPLL